MRKQIIFLILSINFPMLSTAQDFFYTHYQAFDEKSGYKVFEGPYSLTQDKKGLLWIGSDNGLFSFDGTHFRNYRHRNEDSLSLPGNLTLFNFQDSKGKYWTAISGHGLFNFDPITEKFHRFQYNNKKEFDIHQHRIRPPIETTRGTLWFALPGFGIAFYDRQHNIIVPYKICPDNNCGTYYSASWVTAIKEDPHDSTLWLATNNGLLHFFPANGNFEVFLEKKKFSNIYTTLYFDSHKQLWLGTWGAGLKKFDIKTKKFREYKWFKGVAGTKNICTGIGSRENNQLWVGALDRGLMVFETTTSQFRSVRGNSNRADSLIATQMIQNDKAVLWVANPNNIVRLDEAKNFFAYHSLEQTVSQTPAAQGLFSFVRHGNKIYTGIYYEGYIIEYDMFTSRQKMYRLPVSQSGEGVFCLSKDAQNNIWVGSPGGTYIFNPERLLFARPVANVSVHSFFQSPTYFILHDRDSTHWLATKQGLIHFDPKGKKNRWFSYDSSNGKMLKGNNVSNRIYTLFKDTKGNIWFGNNTLGVACYQRANGAIIYFNKSRNKSYPEGNCESITEAKDGSILFTLANYGLCILKKPFTDHETITVLNSSDGLPSDYISAVFRDKEDNHWLFTTNGLCWFDTKTFRIVRFSKDDGLSINWLKSTPYQDDEGNIYIGFSNGFQMFHPYQLLQSQTDKGSLHVASLKINGTEWPVHPDYLSSLTLNYRQTNIAFNFAILYSVQTDGIQFAYKLDGLEKEWNYTGSKTSGQYNNLTPGKYRLRIKAANRRGEWDKKEWILPITIHPPWYGSWWFYTLLAMSGVALLYWFYCYRIGQILKLQRMRTRIASDLHDDIGSTLTSISYYSELVKMKLKGNDISLNPILDKMGDSARNTVNTMSDIVWIINPQNDTTSNLVTRMNRYAAEMLGERNIEFSININEEIEKLKLNMQQRKSLYLIYKEAMHNAVKYSQCSKIEVDFIQTNHQISLQINDNGRGFDMRNANEGNGLNNMKNRAAEIKAQLEISSIQGTGTHVQLTCKIT